MTMPDPGTDLYIATLDYYCTFSPLTASAGPVVFSVPDPVRFTFTFTTGSTVISPGVTQVTWDYSWFVQATVEAGIASTLDAICTAVGTMLGLTQAQVQAAVTVERVWSVVPALQGPGVSSGGTAILNAMAYPAA